MGFAVERRIGTDIGGDVRYSHNDDLASRILGVLVRLGVNSIIMILGIRRIDGEKWNIAPVFAAIHRGCGRSFCFAQRFSRENMRDFMLVDGNHRQGFSLSIEPTTCRTLPRGNP